MLDEKYIKAYNSIKADKCLKEKILARADENFRPKKRHTKSLGYKSVTYIAAACAIMFIGLGIFAMQLSGNIHTELLYKGDVISAEPTQLEESGTMTVSFGAKHITANGLPLEIKADKETKISVSDGELQIFDHKSDELLFVGTDFTTNENVVLFWNLASATGKNPCLVTDNHIEYSEYILEESDENGYIIRLAKRISK